MRESHFANKISQSPRSDSLGNGVRRRNNAPTHADCGTHTSSKRVVALIESTRRDRRVRGRMYIVPYFVPRTMARAESRERQVYLVGRERGRGSFKSRRDSAKDSTYSLCVDKHRPQWSVNYRTPRLSIDSKWARWRLQFPDDQSRNSEL